MRQGHPSPSLRHTSGEAGISQGVWMATEPCQTASWPSGLGEARFSLPPSTLPQVGAGDLEPGESGYPC